MFRTCCFAITVFVFSLGNFHGSLIAQERSSKFEGSIDVFFASGKLTIHKLFPSERFPNIVCGTDGTVIATYGSSTIRCRRSTDGGATWSKEIEIAKPGFQGGGMTVDESTGAVFVFAEKNHPPAKIMVYRSDDQGESWRAISTSIGKDKNGNLPSMHMNEHGITLRHGKHKGRLIRPSRWYAGKNDRKLWPKHYTNAIYSDDHGKSWKTSDPFPENGTGEATLAELSNGTIYYNSRRHWADEGKNPRRRWTAISQDGGQTWKDLKFCQALPDGPQDSNYGCMAGLVRLPIKDRDILLYSNCDSERGRVKGTVWASFDGGKSWPLKRQVFEGRFAYSSMTAGRPGTKSEGKVFLHFEGGEKGTSSSVAVFDLKWILQGTETGDGSLPEWIKVDKPAS